MDEKRDFVEEKKRNYKKYFFLGGGIFFILIFVGIFFFFSLENSPVLNSKCGDGTFNNSCSLNKPYFCLDEVLIKNPSICGCSDSYLFEKGECILINKKLNKTFSFEVNGKKLYFDYYPRVLKYLLNLSRIKSYREGEFPRRDDFKFAKINNKIQREFLIPLVVQIQNSFPDSKEMQAKLAVDFVQGIFYKESNFTNNFDGRQIRLSRYPYQVLFEGEGSCEGKSEFLAFLLRELGFGTTLFYFPLENHEAVGIKCPLKYSYKNSGYCFIETTMPSPISFGNGIYLGLGGQGKLQSSPQIILINDGISLGKIEDYKDSLDLKDLVEEIEKDGSLNFFQEKKLNALREKYHLSW